MYLWHKEKQFCVGNDQQKELPVCCSSVPGSPEGAGPGCSVSVPDLQCPLELGSRNASLLIPATWAAVAHTLSQCLCSHFTLLFSHTGAQSVGLTLNYPLGKD